MKKVISISLALILFISNIGLSLNTHFCGGQAVLSSFTVGLHSPECGMEQTKSDCHHSEKEEKKEDPCCENEHHVQQLEEDAIAQNTSADVSPVFLLAFIQTFVQPIWFADQQLTLYTHYTPPLPHRDFQALFQSYLI